MTEDLFKDTDRPSARETAIEKSLARAVDLWIEGNYAEARNAVISAERFSQISDDTYNELKIDIRTDKE